MAFINQKLKISNKESNSLNTLLRCYRVYGQQSDFEQLMCNPLLKLTIPLLENELELKSKDDLEEIVNKSILLSYCDFDKMEIFCESFDIYIFGGYGLDSYKKNVFTDFVALIRNYNKYEDTDLYYKKETSVFDNLVLDDIKYVNIPPDDSIYILKLYDLDMLSGNAKELIFEFAKYLSEHYNITYQKIYNEFCKSEIYKRFKTEDELNYITLVETVEYDNNFFFFSFLIAYIKLKDLFTIDNGALSAYLYPVYIRAFREFWWKCEMWSKYNSIIDKYVKDDDEGEVIVISCPDYPFLDGVKTKLSSSSYDGLDRLLVHGSHFFNKLEQFGRFSLLMGVDITIDNEYLSNINEPNEVLEKDGFGKNMAINLYGTTFTRDNNRGVFIFPDAICKIQEENKLPLRGRPGRKKKKLFSFLSDIVPKEKQEYVIDFIKEKANEKEHTKSIRVIRAAYEAGLFNELPGYYALIDYGFLTLGSKALYGVKKDEELLLGNGITKQKDLYHTELMDCFLKIRNELCSFINNTD